jgi:hypothetical protein
MSLQQNPNFPTPVRGESILPIESDVKVTSRRSKLEMFPSRMGEELGIPIQVQSFEKLSQRSIIDPECSL